MLRALLVAVVTGCSCVAAVPAAATLPCDGRDACLAASVSGVPDEIAAGADFSYTITAANHGPTTAQNVLLRITVDGAFLVSLSPAAGWTCDTLGVPGESGGLFVWCGLAVAGVGSSVFVLDVTAAPAAEYPALVELSVELTADNESAVYEQRITVVSMPGDAVFSDRFESP